MKQLFIFLLLNASILFASTESIDERVTDIYFGNGILTSEIEAKDDVDNIVYSTVKADIYHGDEAKMSTYHNFELAYNSSFKDTEYTDIHGNVHKLGKIAGGVLDVMESREQLGNTSLGWQIFNAFSSFVYQVGIKRNPVTQVAKKELKDYLISHSVPEYLATYFSVQMTESDLARIKDLSNFAVSQMISDAHDRDLGQMVDAYEKSIEQGHGIIMVTHSQGNLFAIEAVNKIAASKPWMKNYFYHVSIATPATKTAVLTASMVISLDNDPVCFPDRSVGQYVVHSFPPSRWECI